MKKVLVVLAAILAVAVPAAASASKHPSHAPAPHIIGTWPNDVSPSGDGGYLVWSNGAVEAVDKAPFYGSLKLDKPVNNIVGFEADPLSGGYWLIAANGTVYGLGSTCEDQKLVRPNGAPKSGVVGAINLANDGEGFGMVTSSGHVYSFDCRPRASAPIGTQLAELSGSDAVAGDEFGWRVAVSGTTIVVAAPDHAGHAGRAYVFTKTAGGWAQSGELTGSDTAAGDDFGWSVAASGTTVVVGAPNHAAYAGRAYVFTKSAGGWAQSGELTGSDTAAGDDFGWSVAASGTTVVVGAPNHAAYAGRAYVFTKSAGGWARSGELTGSDTAAGDDFGWSVAASGTTVVVGAVSHATYAGRAYVFTKAAASWKQVAELKGSDTVAGDGVGDSVALSGTMAVVGAGGADDTSGRAYVFHATASGWSQIADLQESDKTQGDNFGVSVAISGTTVVIGGTRRAYVFTKSGSAWNEVAGLKGSDSASGDQFGSSVTISGISAVVGAPGHASKAGRAYLFEA